MWQGAGGTFHPDLLVAPLPRLKSKLTVNDVTSEVPKCCKIQAYGVPPAPELMGRGARCRLQRIPTPLSAFGPRFYGSQGLTLLMIDFKCRPMKFVFFSVSENGDNGLGDEWADWGNAPARMLGLEPPLLISVKFVRG